MAGMGARAIQQPRDWSIQFGDAQITSMDDTVDKGELSMFLGGLPSNVLVQILVDLAEDHQPVRARLQRLQVGRDPEALTARFAERLRRWQEDDRYVRLEEAGELCRELRVWLDEVGREVLPQYPKYALAQFEAFIQIDGALLERVDDSGGDVGFAFELACGWWRRAALASGIDDQEMASRVAMLLANDNYCARRTLAGGESNLPKDQSLWVNEWQATRPRD